MRVLMATDAFPPRCGGSGWSTYELARGLRARGHDILVVRLAGRPPSEVGEYDGFRPIVLPAWAPPVPFVRNYFTNERLYRRAGRRLAGLIGERGVDVVHGQHLRSAPAAIAAARARGVPVVCTVRDFWPVCYWSDLIYDPAAASLCPGCSARMMARCLRPHAGVLWPLGLPAIPYMRANLAGKRRSVARADAVIAVSHALAGELRVRAPELDARRVEVIPNPVDVAALRRAADARPRPLTSPYAVFVGKLAPNKGASSLPAVARQAHLDWPLVIVGDGPERAALERALGAAGVSGVFTGWVPREEVLGWLRHAELLVFPSRGPESLSRVLLEASALGVAIAAMDTGGTRDIVVHEETGLLADDPKGLAGQVARLRQDEALRRRLGAAARQRVEERFDAAVVVAAVEALYQDLLERTARRRASREERDG